jgi:hypothetical protein
LSSNLLLPTKATGRTRDHEKHLQEHLLSGSTRSTGKTSRTRIAIISTPRSGNTWARSVLRETLGLHEIAVHNPRDIPSSLPERMVLQLHWYREPNLQRFLTTNEFRVLIISRHPLDVLISAWHFAQYEPLTTRWLEGNTELPRNVGDDPPASRAFLSYATSWGAENFLSVSYQWWHEPSAMRSRYEDLVRDPTGTFGDLIRSFGGSPQQLAPALEKNRLAVYQGLPNRHGWHGRPGLWRKVVPQSIAFRVWRRHRRVFTTLGYGAPLTATTRRQAIRNWDSLR